LNFSGHLVLCKLSLKLHFPECLYCLKGAVFQPGLFPHSVLQADSSLFHSQPASCLLPRRTPAPGVSWEAQRGCLEPGPEEMGVGNFLPELYCLEWAVWPQRKMQLSIQL